MELNSLEQVWSRGRVLKKAFLEYGQCLEYFYAKIKVILNTPSHIPKEFTVEMGEVPREFFALKKNVFSILFQSVYHLLGINTERRLLYGKLNHLFRIWVTSADNLLDSEDKVVIPIRMPGQAPIMRQVISIMAADRVMQELFEEAVNKKIISSEEANILSLKTLSILLPSAAEEASEEGGMVERPPAQYVLHTIHKLKTGLLFHIPFLGPENIEDNIDHHRLKRCKEALIKFGLGCQLLDDIRDMAKDHLEKRHNYVWSKMAEDERTIDLNRLKILEEGLNTSAKIFSYFPEVVYPAAALARDLLEEGIFILEECGLGMGEGIAKEMAVSIFQVLDVGELVECLEIELIPN